MTNAEIFATSHAPHGAAGHASMGCPACSIETHLARMDALIVRTNARIAELSAATTRKDV